MDKCDYCKGRKFVICKHCNKLVCKECDSPVCYGCVVKMMRALADEHETEKTTIQ